MARDGIGSSRTTPTSIDGIYGDAQKVMVQMIQAVKSLDGGH